MKRRKLWLLVLALFTALVLATVMSSAVWVRATSYEVPLDVAKPVRTVMLTDLHGKSFGRENFRLIAKIREQSPDAIFLDGDMIDRSADSSDVQELLRLIERLCEISPVYFAPGNHELTYANRREFPHAGSRSRCRSRQ